MNRIVAAVLMIVALFFALSPLLLTAQSVDTVVVAKSFADSVAATPPAMSLHDLLNLAITLALGLLTPPLMRALECLSSWLRDQNPLVKRTIVTAIPSLISLACATLARYYPWFPWDPSVLNSMIATAIAFSVHAGDQAKKAQAAAQGGT